MPSFSCISRRFKSVTMLFATFILEGCPIPFRSFTTPSPYPKRLFRYFQEMLYSMRWLHKLCVCIDNTFPHYLCRNLRTKGQHVGCENSFITKINGLARSFYVLISRDLSKLLNRHRPSKQKNWNLYVNIRIHSGSICRYNDYNNCMCRKKLKICFNWESYWQLYCRSYSFVHVNGTTFRNSRF